MVEEEEKVAVVPPHPGAHSTPPPTLSARPRGTFPLVTSVCSELVPSHYYFTPNSLTNLCRLWPTFFPNPIDLIYIGIFRGRG